MGNAAWPPPPPPHPWRDDKDQSRGGAHDASDVQHGSHSDDRFLSPRGSAGDEMQALRAHRIDEFVRRQVTHYEDKILSRKVWQRWGPRTPVHTLSTGTGTDHGT